MVYALDPESRRVVVIPVNGGPAKTLFDLPWSQDMFVNWTVAMTADARKFVFSVRQSQEDTWIIENFDPEAAEARRFLAKRSQRKNSTRSQHEESLSYL